MTKCVYCNQKLTDDRAIDVCDRCGKGVWGEKMFNTIRQNMENAKKNDDLCSTNMNPEFAEEESFRKFKGK